MARYLVPKPIVKGYEVFPGWSLTQAGIVAGGLVAAAVVFGLLTLFSVPVVIRLFAGIVVTGIGAILAYPPPAGDPGYRVIRRWWAYRHQPHRYLYDWTVSDWPPDLEPLRNNPTE